MQKAAAFLTEYMKAYKACGANGVVIAEPLTGLLSPELAAEFSEPYVKQVIDAVQDDEFIVIYHNCGNNTIDMIESILRVGATGYHFGNSIDMRTMLEKIPAGVPVMGNVDPAVQFRNGRPRPSGRRRSGLWRPAARTTPTLSSPPDADIPPPRPGKYRRVLRRGGRVLREVGRQNQKKTAPQECTCGVLFYAIGAGRRRRSSQG